MEISVSVGEKRTRFSTDGGGGAASKLALFVVSGYWDSARVSM